MVVEFQQVRFADRGVLGSTFKPMSVKKRVWMIVGRLAALISGTVGTLSWMALKASTNAAAHGTGSLATEGQRIVMNVAAHSMESAPGDLLKEVPTESGKGRIGPAGRGQNTF